MKRTLLLVTLMPLFLANINAQTFALNVPPVPKTVSAYTQPNNLPHARRHKMGPITIVGISMACVGGGLLIPAGFISVLGAYEDGRLVSQSSLNAGHAMEYGGLAMMIVGIGMSIGGGIDDHARMRNAKLGIVAPKRNELGLAYKF